MFESILCQVTEYDPDVLESLIGLAVEIAREGREGGRVGTLRSGSHPVITSKSKAIRYPWRYVAHARCRVDGLFFE